MPIAAIPNYLIYDFSEASPALRFGPLLPIWTERSDQEREVRRRAEARSREGRDLKDILDTDGMDAAITYLRERPRNRLSDLWDKNDFAAREVWKKLVALSRSDLDQIHAFNNRQAYLAKAATPAAIVSFDAIATAPFTTGLGNEHPLENGFAFLNPYGLPYLPGSGVKGVLRQAARELASGEWGETCGWSEDNIFNVIAGKERIDLSIIDLLFGLESKDRDSEHFRGVLSFWDVIPRIKGNSLAVEIMTPHHSHYYQQKQAAESTTPHDSGQPTPICFLTVPPGSEFTFHVVCDTARLRKLAPEIAQDKYWETLLRDAFDHAFQWLGFGAKTAVGYGAMVRDRSAEEEASQQAEATAAKARQEAEARRKSEEAAAEAARQQAEFDALPEHEKALRAFESELARFIDPLRTKYSDFAGLANKLAEQALAWPDPEAKARAAEALEAAYQKFGWTEPGLKADKRKKQEQKKRDRINALRGPA